MGILILFMALITPGCGTVSYYRQAIGGQLGLLAKRKSIDQLIAANTTSEELREKLRLVLRLREFAQQELRLPVDNLYLTYADLGRSMAIWSVHAARPFSLEAKTWWYPLLGDLQYRGYFSENQARSYARELEKEGYEVDVAGVEAYSTLGWFRDPVLNTFISHDPREVAEILFHELAHQRLFVNGETDWNEAFAVAVAEEGVRRWLLATHRLNEAEIYRRDSGRSREFLAMIATARDRLALLYDQAKELRLDPEHPGPAFHLVRGLKENVLSDLAHEYERFKERWDGFSGYDGWFEQPLNNAQLAALDSYFRLVPLFQNLLARADGDLESFYQQVERLSALPKRQREEAMAQTAP